MAATNLLSQARFARFVSRHDWHAPAIDRTDNSPTL